MNSKPVLPKPDAAMRDVIDHFVDQHRAQCHQLPAAELKWLQRMRRDGLDAFKHLGFPHARDENWRYTSVQPIIRQPFAVDAAAGAALTPAVVAELALLGQPLDQASDQASDQAQASHTVVLVDGVFRPELSTSTAPPADVQILGLAQALRSMPQRVKAGLEQFAGETESGFGALNRAFLRDGVVVLAARGAVLPQLQILHIGATAHSAAQPRIIVDAAPESQLSIIEHYTSAAEITSLTNGVSTISVAPGAAVDYYIVQTPSNQSYQVSRWDARVQAGGRFSCRSVSLGGALVRNDVHVELAAPGAHCDLLGLSSLTGQQHVDNHTSVLHAAESCRSRELYKNVLDQRSRGVFHGRIKVAAGAQQTDAEQTNKTLLLSRQAEIDTKPQLEIYADDVKCAHGATVGQLDAQALFYLRTRGVGPEQARALLTFAFINEILQTVPGEALRAALQKIVVARLQATASKAMPAEPMRLDPTLDLPLDAV